MNIIFLDVDGVLNSSGWNKQHPNEIKKGFLIDETKVFLLGELIRKTNAEIVLHSGWRFWFDGKSNPNRKESEYFYNLLKKENISFYDFTPDFSTEEIRRTKEFSLVKAEEILCWIKGHGEVSGWIVIDDLELNNEIISAHQVKTNSSKGFEKEDMEKALKLFAEQNK
ncbi:MAG: hypothetical protein E7479_01400 [Ruminococcaceae bacterium]|nr:hypothetical protein [Oscillospiraceae bacterium]